MRNRSTWMLRGVPLPHPPSALNPCGPIAARHASAALFCGASLSSPPPRSFTTAASNPAATPPPFAPPFAATPSIGSRLAAESATTGSRRHALGFAMLSRRASSATFASRMAVAAAVHPPFAQALLQCRRHHGISATRVALAAADGSGGGSPPGPQQAAKSGRADNVLQGYREVTDYKPPEDEKKSEQEEAAGGDGNDGPGYLPFPPPLHTINIMSLLLLGNVLIYMLMNWSGSDDLRDTLIEHFTLSHENYWKIYPFFTSAFYQEHLLQLVIDGWLLFQFGNTMLGFLGNKRLTFFWGLCMLGGGMIHIAKQHVELYYGLDPLEVRGRVYGANPFILGLVGVEGLIFRHLNFMHNPPVPFLVLTAFVMVIDVWRIFTMKPDEHGASTGGALVAYVFWALPTKLMGLNKLTATL